MSGSWASRATPSSADRHSVAGLGSPALRSDKELLAIPLFGVMVTLLVVAAFGGAAFFTLTETIDTAGTTGYEPSGLTYAVGVVAYLVLSIVTTYFTAVLASGAHQRLTGSEPSLGSSFAGATQLGFGFVGFLAALPGVAVAVLVFLVVPVVGIALGVVWVAAVALVMSALNGIFRTALYQYATTGQVPDGFSDEAITHAFAPPSRVASPACASPPGVTFVLAAHGFTTSTCVDVDGGTR